MKLLATTFAVALLSQTGAAHADSYSNTYIQFYNDSMEPIQIDLGTSRSNCSILATDQGNDTASTSFTVQPGIPSPLVNILQITNWSNNLCFNGIVKYSVGVQFQSHAPLNCTLSNTKILNNGENGGYQADPACQNARNPSLFIDSNYSMNKSGYITTFRVGAFTDSLVKKSSSKNFQQNTTRMNPHTHPMTAPLHYHAHPLKEVERYNTSKINPMVKGRKMMNPKPMMERRQKI